MQKFVKTGSLLLMGLTMACTQGYYDVNGKYRADQKSYSTFRHGPNVVDEHVRVNPSVSHIYTQPGYYDREGRFIAPLEQGPHVPAEYLPAKGMCRVWFNNRAGSQQPSSEYCPDIWGLVPSGAFVIYGG